MLCYTVYSISFEYILTLGELWLKSSFGFIYFYFWIYLDIDFISN